MAKIRLICPNLKTALYNCRTEMSEIYSVDWAIAQWFSDDEVKRQIIAQCRFQLDTENRVLTIDCPKTWLHAMKALSGELGESILSLGVELVRLVCHHQVISQFYPTDAIYVQRLWASQLRSGKAQ
jgi:hypothetical protein